MTLKRWFKTVLACLLCQATFWYAVYHVDNAWGMVILACNVVAGFLLLVNTTDLLFGRWLRRGTALAVPANVALPIITRTLILQETRYADEWDQGRDAGNHDGWVRQSGWRD